ncbi:hypothetical protein PAXRUDRAFT_539176 [Paxillus rubicundulus Ve08.2h10]|uniref:Uncharacterized protein n=1 Tax=Paxillus rubicundulus Ve08.2h10 TaxID=930991 RepID=A0A0D0EDB0_9AGAM|nr:hypothetical protein PAXRUDRAFT_539176 [Paxillus rubicundulus Ve08.2h10]
MRTHRTSLAGFLTVSKLRPRFVELKATYSSTRGCGERAVVRLRKARESARTAQDYHQFVGRKSIILVTSNGNAVSMLYVNKLWWTMTKACRKTHNTTNAVEVQGDEDCFQGPYVKVRKSEEHNLPMRNVPCKSI